VCFCVNLDHCIPVLLAFVVLSFVFFLVPSQEIGWEERLRNDIFCVEWDEKTLTQLISQSALYSFDVVPNKICVRW